MPSPASPEHVILVHGTGAGDPADRGDKWWQLGSTFAQRLAEALSAATVEKPFHWSGANSEQARRAAANALLSRLAEYEHAGESVQPYPK